MTGGLREVQPMAACTALLCLVAALWYGLGAGRTPRRTRLLFAPAGAGSAPSAIPGADERAAGTPGLFAALGQGRAWRRWWQRGRAEVRRRDLGGEVACLPAGMALALATGSALPLVGALAAALAGRRWRRGRAEERERERRRAAVIGLCAAIAGELRAGRQPGPALCAVEVAQFPDAWRAVTTAARFGGDVPGALREAARLPGAEGLAGVAACWRAAVDGGAGLAVGLDRVAVALRAESDQRAELTAQLAGVRATAVMLALLPVFGLVMGSALGAEPLRILLETPAGLGCLALGVLLEWAGLIWTARIARRAAAPTAHPPRKAGSGKAEGVSECCP
ncbi:type II secretion system F family protein [Streptomyces sp. 796.1]|uniref:type II secretion system F family protein n=1 Tax=Streptomyces sp. 796.1 TaxID=3163029 RepID=UPI0039C8C3CA